MPAGNLLDNRLKDSLLLQGNTCLQDEENNYWLNKVSKDYNQYQRKG